MIIYTKPSEKMISFAAVVYPDTNSKSLLLWYMYMLCVLLSYILLFFCVEDYTWYLFEYEINV